MKVGFSRGRLGDTALTARCVIMLHVRQSELACSIVHSQGMLASEIWISVPAAIGSCREIIAWFRPTRLIDYFDALAIEGLKSNFILSDIRIQRNIVEGMAQFLVFVLLAIAVPSTLMISLKNLASRNFAIFNIFSRIFESFWYSFVAVFILVVARGCIRLIS